MVRINQGDIFLHDFGTPRRSEPGYSRPCVVIQKNLLNWSKINTVIVCILTSNLELAKISQNIFLKKSQTGLKKDCVANVSQVATLDKSALVKKIGKISPEIVRQISTNICSNISCSC